MNNDVGYLSKILELINKIEDIDKNNDLKKLEKAYLKEDFNGELI